MITEFEKELIKEIKLEAEAIKSIDPHIQRILIICDTLLNQLKLMHN